MVSSVTVHGSHATNISLSFDSTANFLLAQQMANAINTSITDGKLVTSSDTDGPPPHVPLGSSGGYFQTSTSFVALPHNYTVDLINVAGPALVIGSGAPKEMILSSIDTSLTFIAAGGSGSVVAGGGNDRLLIPGSNAGSDWALYTGDGNDLISALGQGQATIGAGGGTNTILLGDGKDLIFSSGEDKIVAGGGAETVDALKATSDFVQGNASKLLFVGGHGGATILGGSGSDTYFGSTTGPAGPQLIKGGSAGNNYLVAGDGSATLAGGGSGDQLIANGTFDQMLIAGSGNETLNAAPSTGADKLVAGSGKDLLIGGGGSDTYVGGSGHSTVLAGYETSTFEFIKHQAGGPMLVTDIVDPTAIKIDLDGYGAGAANAALATQKVHNGSVTINLSDGTKVTFEDISSLNKSNFV